MKKCTRCGTQKALSEFPVSKYASQKPDAISKGRYSWCHSCILAQKREHYHKNIELMKARAFRWRIKNKSRYSDYMKRRYRENPERYRDQTLRRLYGISLDQYNALLKSQNNCCAICLSDKLLYVDHCHETGAIRGLLCSNCNHAAGNVKDSPVIAKRLASYLHATFAGPTDDVVGILYGDEL